MRRVAALVAIGLSTLLVVHLRAQPPVKTFQGYWMGIDPVDGGDQRRSLVERENGMFAMSGRDTRLTLCDHTDYGLATFEDGVVSANRRTIETDQLTLTCFGNGSSITLRARYELVNEKLMLETVTREDGTLVHTMALHKVSQ